MFNAANMQDAPLSLCLIDRQGCVLSANTAFEMLVGNVPVGAPVDTVVAFDDIKALIASVECKSVMIQVAGIADVTQQFHAILSPVDDSAAALLQLLEIDSHQELSAKWQLSQKSSGNIASNKVDFLSAISHQIRTPVNGVLGIAELLSETHLSAEQAKYVDMLSRSGHALIHLVNEIQEIALLEQGATTVARDKIDIRALVKGAMDLFSVSVTQKGVSGIAEIDDNVPSVLVSDRKKLHQILVNLISNAFQYSEQGKVIVSLRMETSGSDDNLVIQVTDKGAGIEPDLLPHILKKSLPDNIREKGNYSKMGLGLLLCKEFVALMGGTIEIDSKLGQGTSVRVVVPAQPAQAADTVEDGSADATETKDPYTPRDEGPWNLLVTEDNPVNQMLFKKILERAGHRVTVASNGQEAVAKLQLGNSFDAILMDISMPVMDGLDATSMIRSLYGPLGSTPILALTAHAMDGDREKFLNAGMDGYQSKPVDPVTLLKAIADIIHTRAQDDLPEKRSMAQAQSAHQASERDY